MQLINNNQATLALIKNAYINNRWKQIDITFYYVKDFYKNNYIRISFVRSANIIIDKLTKLLLKDRFKIFIK